MNTLIKTIEDLSLNAWPSHQIELYDGWILRFSYFYTHRTNSVEQIGPSTIPVEEKVQYCEEIYRRWGTPADAAAFTMLKEQLEDVLSTLTDREQKVLRLRFGLDDGRARTLEEVGKEFNVTRERIRQIEAKALRKLRHPSRSRKLKDYLD